MNDQTTEAATTEATATENKPEASLGLNDIRDAIRCIDFAAEQGAYKGWQTIQQVLIVRNRLNAFVSAVAPPTAATEGAEQASETAAEANTSTEAAQ